MSAYQNGQLRNGDNDNDQLQLLWIRIESRMILYVGKANILSARIILCFLACSYFAMWICECCSFAGIGSYQDFLILLQHPSVYS